MLPSTAKQSVNREKKSRSSGSSELMEHVSSLLYTPRKNIPLVEDMFVLSAIRESPITLSPG
jgi:hypothetical protein